MGKTIAECYASLGANIVFNDPKDASAGDTIIADINAKGLKAIAVQADISKAEDVERLFNKVKEAFGKIDIVVANAGIQLATLHIKT